MKNWARKTDEELITMYAAGEMTAFDTLFQRYKRPIYSFIYRIFPNRETAGDLTQDVFAKVIQKADTFAGRAKFSTWIYTIARNRATDHLRAARHRQHRSLDAPVGVDQETPLVEKVAGHTPSPERRTANEELRDAISDAVASLPPDQREVFVLRQYQGLPFQEIANVVGAQLGTVKSRMRYALASLRTQLNQYEQAAGDHP